MRAVCDYRPQHDDGCEALSCVTCARREDVLGHIGDPPWFEHVFEARPCSCGLDEAIRPCVWRYDDTGDMWHTACGHTWQFTVGTPADNGQHFCGYCGRHTAAVVIRCSNTGGNDEE